MRKLDLIKKLQELKGNPEIMLWNGHVGDFVPVGDLGVSDLVKISKESWMRGVKAEAHRDGEELEPESELNRMYNKISYESNRFVSEADIKTGLYKRKKIGYIDAKLTGKTTWDRLGNISY